MLSAKYRTNKRDVLAVLPKRRPESHKGDYGRLLIVGGGSRYVGAPALAGLAALRSGVDLAIIAAPEKTAWTINSFSPDLITVKLPCRDLESSAFSELWGELERSTAVVVGPGVGTLAKTRDAVIEFARALREKYPNLPALFDADGLKALASEKGLAQGMPWVMTPHAGELKLLTGSDFPSDLRGRVAQVKLAAQGLGCVVLLKSHVDIIASAAGDVKLNYTGNPGMTVGGTGDVLAGIVGTFLAQEAEPFKAAVAGAWACGRAGDLCLREKGYEFVASDLIDKLPDVFREVRGKR
ncbi:MAG: NAD(P)H-hydrate dehydratase [Candidatus Hodarchaeaceae archaeon]|nr:NAD(P)H-hydrate dehydratase [Candidatus Hodarchaeaceae archaeon]MDI6884200.1 NAD(P)H-hydrate dehydratase [Hadesarchaea archaeon]